METLPLNAGVNAAAAEAQWRNGLLGQTVDEPTDEIQAEAGDGQIDAGFAAALLASLPQTQTATDGPWLVPVWTDMPSAEELASLLAAGEVPAISADASVAAAETPATGVASAALVLGSEASLPPDQMVWLPSVAGEAGTAEKAASPKTESSQRRGREGLRLYAEVFPEGWETLLEEAPQARPNARTLAAAGAEPQVRAAVAIAETPDSADQAPATSGRVLQAVQPARAQTGLTLPVPTAAANSGNSPNGETPAAAAVESHRTVAAPEGEAAPAPESAEPAVGWKTTVSTTLAAGRASTHETWSAPTQVLQRFSEMEKQLTIQEFSRAAASGLRRGEERISVDLHPPELGRVRVVVESRGDQVNAQLTLQDAGVGEFFQDRLDTIRRQLTDAGVKLGQLTVEVRQQFADHPSGTAAERREAEAEAQDKNPSPTQPAAASHTAALAPGQKVNVVM